MARVSKNKRNKRYYKATLTEQELNTVTIALALLNIPQLEDEMKEQGLAEDKVEFNHLELFEPFAEMTNLYPKKEKGDS